MSGTRYFEGNQEVLTISEDGKTITPGDGYTVFEAMVRYVKFLETRVKEYDDEKNSLIQEIVKLRRVIHDLTT